MNGDVQGALGLRLDPLDVLFFRDGRPFDAAARVSGGLPNPQTLAGALRTALLARSGRFQPRAFAARRRARGIPANDHEARRQLHEDLRSCGAADWIVNTRFRGSWLGLARAAATVEPLLAWPETLAKDSKGDWLRAEPRHPKGVPGWDDPQLWPLWRSGVPDTKASKGLLTLAGLKRFLLRQDVSAEDVFSIEELYGYDNRTGIGIDMRTLTSADGKIYGIRLLSLKPRVREDPKNAKDPYHKAAVCLYAEILPGAGAPDLQPYLAEPIPFGGEGKYVRVEIFPRCQWPMTDAKAPRSLWYLATPAFLGADAARPPLHMGLTLRAAASGPGVAVSGWDVARNGPRPTRFAVPAGANYFLEGPVTADGPFNLKENDADEGWGFALQGIW